MSIDKDNVKNRLILLPQRRTQRLAVRKSAKYQFDFELGFTPSSAEFKVFPKIFYWLRNKTAWIILCQIAYHCIFYLPMFCKTSVLCLFHSYKFPHTRTIVRNYPFMQNVLWSGLFLHLAWGSGNEVLPIVNDLFLSLSSIKSGSPWNKVIYM